MSGLRVPVVGPRCQIRLASAAPAAPNSAIDTSTPANSTKAQTHSPQTACFQRFSPNGSALWQPHRLKLRPRRHRSGGIAPHEGPTRRRHADAAFRMAQNPHHHRRGAHQQSRKARPQCPGAMAGLGQVSSRHTEPPSTPLSPYFRYKTLPAHPPSPYFRYKTLPAHPKWLDLAQSTHAGRVLYRSHHQEAEQGEFCTEREAEIELADTTALQAPPVWSGRHPRSRRNPPQCRRAAAGPARVGTASASQISHAIPPRHDPTKAQKPQNIND